MPTSINLLTATTSFDEARKKYNNFRGYRLQIKVNSLDIIEQFYVQVSAISIELTCDYEASWCSFEITGGYVKYNNFFSSELYSSLQIGSLVEIFIGYEKTEPVFYGLISKIGYSVHGNGISIIVECMDAKCLLMKTQHQKIMIEKKLSQAVDIILSGQPISSYIKGKKIEPTDGENINLLVEEDDFSFVSKQAKYWGYEFFILQGIAYFRKRPTTGSPILTMKFEEMVFEQNLIIDGSGLVKKITVSGISPVNNKEVKGSAEISGKFSEGSTAAQMIGQKEKIIYDPLVKNAEAATARAVLLSEQIKRQFGKLRLHCYGLPELAPGRFINVDGMLPQKDCSAYIKTVRHDIDSISGFISTIEAEVTSL